MPCTSKAVNVHQSNHRVKEAVDNHCYKLVERHWNNFDVLSITKVVADQ